MPYEYFSLERLTRFFSGALILITLYLSQAHTSEWLYLTLLFGVSLFQSGLTDWCPLMAMLRFLGVKPICDIYFHEMRRKQSSLKS
jgi:hypothetical protein